MIVLAHRLVATVLEDLEGASEPVADVFFNRCICHAELGQHLVLHSKHCDERHDHQCGQVDGVVVWWFKMDVIGMGRLKEIVRSEFFCCAEDEGGLGGEQGKVVNPKAGRHSEIEQEEDLRPQL